MCVCFERHQRRARERERERGEKRRTHPSFPIAQNPPPISVPLTSLARCSRNLRGAVFFVVPCFLPRKRRRRTRDGGGSQRLFRSRPPPSVFVSRRPTLERGEGRKTDEQSKAPTLAAAFTAQSWSYPPPPGPAGVEEERRAERNEMMSSTFLRRREVGYPEEGERCKVTS